MLKTPTAKVPGGTPTARQNGGDPRYQSTAWKRLSQVMRRLNPVCQRILNVGGYKNEQCHNPAALVHHYHGAISRPDLFFTASNLIAICFSCHVDTDGTDGVNGAPLWVEGKDYVATVLPRWGLK